MGKDNMKKSSLIIFGLCGLAIIWGIISCSKQDRIGLVKTFEAAYNNHDVENALALLAEDAILEKDIRKFNGLEKILNLAPGKP